MCLSCDPISYSCPSLAMGIIKTGYETDAELGLGLSLGVTVYSNAECTCEICETHVTTCFARSSNSQVVD